MQEDEREDEKPDHHRQGGEVVRVGRLNEALVLVVPQGADGDLCQSILESGRGSGELGVHSVELEKKKKQKKKTTKLGKSIN